VPGKQKIGTQLICALALDSDAVRVPQRESLGQKVASNRDEYIASFTDRTVESTLQRSTISVLNDTPRTKIGVALASVILLPSLFMDEHNPRNCRLSETYYSGNPVSIWFGPRGQILSIVLLVVLSDTMP